MHRNFARTLVTISSPFAESQRPDPDNERLARARKYEYQCEATPDLITWEFRSPTLSPRSVCPPTGMAGLQIHLGSLGIWRRHRAICALGTYLVT